MDLLLIQSTPITTKVVSSDPAHGDMYAVVFSGYSGVFHQSNRPPRYNWNIVESGVKHSGPNPKHVGIFDWMFCDTASLDRIKNYFEDIVRLLI